LWGDPKQGRGKGFILEEVIKGGKEGRIVIQHAEAQ
jgi:hypothetical protein